MVNNTKQPSPDQPFLPYYLFALAATAFYASSFYSYLLFHSLIEIACVVFTLTIFVLAWNAQKLLDNHYILFLGISFLSTATFELVHLFAYKGFGVFPGFDANLPTQLWIAFRYVFCCSFLLAPFFITRRLNVAATLTGYAIITALLFAAIFSGVFPDCYFEDKGFTSFEVYSEYVIILTLLGALVFLIKKGALFDAHVLKMLTFAIISAAAADAAFTQYLSAYDQANLIGHLFLFLSAVLIYRAIVVTGFKNPMAIIFRNLERSEEHFRLIAETSVDIIFQLDGTGQIVFCSPSVSQYGYSAADVINKDFSAYIAKEDLGRAASYFKRAIGGEHLKALELNLLAADGRPYSVEINITPITVNGTVIGLQGISRDITARKETEQQLQGFTVEIQAANTALNISNTKTLKLMQDAIDARTLTEKTNEALSREIVEHKLAEAALRASEQFNKAVLDTAGALVVVLDMEGRIQRFNHACETVTGYTSAEVQGHIFRDLFVPDEEVEDVRRIWERLLAGDFPNSHENHWTSKDGSRRLISWTNTAIIQDGKMVYVIGAGLDITERKQIEEAHKASETRYRDLTESIPAMLWAADIQGHTIDHNRRWYEYTGQTAEQSRGEGWKEIIHPDDLQRVTDLWGQSVRTGKHYLIEYRIRRAADGEYRWHSVQAHLRKKQHGELPGWFGTCVDIEDLKRAEQQLTISLTEKDALLREIHHRVKNNLQIISSLVSLQADSLADEQMREVFSDIRDRVRAMALVHEKLYQTGNLAQLNFADYTASLLQYLWRSHGIQASKVQLQLHIEPIVLPIEMAVPCALILNELAGNALKHAFPDGNGGQVTVAMELDHASETACLRVSDNGIGLPKGLDWRQAESLGLRLVQILTRQLLGTVETGTGPSTEFRVTFCLNGTQS